MPTSLDCVDPFIGVDGPGCTLCGPYHPLGLVRLEPDTIPPHKTNGYQSDRPLQGFSHTYVSGTGGQGRFGNIRLSPFIGSPRLESVAYDTIREEARVGRYSVELDPGKIQVELTCSARCGVSRFTFPMGQAAKVLIAASAVHKNHFEVPARCISSSIEWTSIQNFVGQGTFESGWGHDYPYQIFFFGEVDKAPYSVHCADQDDLTNTRLATGPSSKSVAHWIDTDTVEVRIGVSFVSIANAQASVERDVRGKTFEEVETENRAARQLWFDRVT